MFLEVIATVVMLAGVDSLGAVSFSVNHDGSYALGAKVPLVGSKGNVISVTGGTSSAGVVHKGLTLENVVGNSLSVSHTGVSSFGSQLTAAAKANLLLSNHNRLDTNAFVTRNMPNNPDVSNFNTVGGGVDYMYKNTLGASVGAARTPLLHRTDYSAVGKLNLFQSSKASLDFNASFGKSISPKFNTGWEPSAALTFTRFFRMAR